jgi:glucosamine--fructose-6-phosphate aminotransferase (isomerizing)
MAEPELRSGPPWIMEEMVAAQPAVVRALLDTPPEAVAPVAAAIAAGGPVTVVGCGTSEHGATAIAALLDEALGREWPPRALARQSLDAAERPQSGGVCIGISHDGGTRATTLALEEAAAAGATTALVTNVPGGSASGPAEHLIVTPVHDDSWCHTVAYTSSIAVGAALARELGLEGVDGARAEAVLHAGIERQPAALTGADRVVTTGFGLDLITARELALKIAEGARIPAAAFQLETLLHGHLAGEDGDTAAVLVDTGPAATRPERRATMAAAALGEIGVPVLTLVPADDELRGSVERLLAGAAALQTLTLALAGARGVNPDLIRREEEPYRRAGSVAEGDW